MDNGCYYCYVCDYIDSNCILHIEREREETAPCFIEVSLVRLVCLCLFVCFQ